MVGHNGSICLGARRARERGVNPRSTPLIYFPLTLINCREFITISGRCLRSITAEEVQQGKGRTTELRDFVTHTFCERSLENHNLICHRCNATEKDVEKSKEFEEGNIAGNVIAVAPHQDGRNENNRRGKNDEEEAYFITACNAKITIKARVKSSSRA